jgi:hypothetical protein
MARPSRVTATQCASPHDSARTGGVDMLESSREPPASNGRQRNTLLTSASSSQALQFLRRRGAPWGCVERGGATPWQSLERLPPCRRSPRRIPPSRRAPPRPPQGGRQPQPRRGTRPLQCPLPLPPTTGMPCRCTPTRVPPFPRFQTWRIGARLLLPPPALRCPASALARAGASPKAEPQPPRWPQLHPAQQQHDASFC